MVQARLGLATMPKSADAADAAALALCHLAMSPVLSPRARASNTSHGAGSNVTSRERGA